MTTINKHGLPVQRCKGADCDAEIFFLATHRAVTPVDAQPADDGIIRVLWHDGLAYADQIDSPSIRESFYPGETWYRPHWASCPNAEEFRQERERQQELRRRLAGP